MNEFKGRVAVITGAASGIGYAMAERFASDGMKLAIADIHRPSLEDAAAKLRSTGGTVIAETVDVSDAGTVEAFAAKVFDEYGAVHLLCNNAGVGLGHRPTWEHTLQDWRWIIGINLYGVVHGIASFVPRMRASGTPGHIVNTASMAGMTIGEAGGAPYSATKHAVVAISESLYGELKREEANLSVSVLCPGWVDTGIVANSKRDAPNPSLLEGSMAEFPGAFPPAFVADQVLEAIRDDRFYVLAAQDDFLSWMKMRHDRIQAGRNPAVPRRQQ